MKKHMISRLTCCLLICVVFVICACGPVNKQDIRVESRVFEDNSHTNSNVVVRYPEFISEDDGFEKINRQVEEKAKSFAESVYLQDYINLDLNIEYAYSISDKYISVAFEGMGNISTVAHPNNHCQTIIFSREDKSILTLSDMFEVDDAFVSLFMKHLQEKDSAFMNYFNETYDAASLLEACDDGSSGCYSYITDTEIIISFQVPHAIGDYVKVSLPLEEIK